MWIQRAFINIKDDRQSDTQEQTKYSALCLSFWSRTLRHINVPWTATRSVTPILLDEDNVLKGLNFICAVVRKKYYIYSGKWSLLIKAIKRKRKRNDCVTTTLESAPSGCQVFSNIRWKWFTSLVFAAASE